MNNSNQPSSQRILSNTIVLFLRMLLLTMVNLYSIRIILGRMGTEDYGIYNAVAGVVTISSFISGVLDLAIQRFYSYAMGAKQRNQLIKIFSISIKCSAILALIIFIILELAGLWYIENKLVVPIEKIGIATLCFHFAVITFLCTILQIPFTSTIFAHEDMGIYAAISSVECLLKLLVAFLIGKVFWDNLSFYCLGLMLVAILIYISYALWGYNRYEECKHYINVKDTGLYKKILSFSGWTLFGSFAKITMVQGSTLLLNSFFGPLTNASFAIALQISNAFTTLSNNMVLAVRPAMIKSYAEKNEHYLQQLFSFSNKFMYYLLLIIGLPMIIEMPLIEKIWLEDSVNQEIILFSRLVIIYTICLAMNNPITIIIQATGNIKRYHLCVESVTLMSLPVAWILFHYHYEAYHIYTAMIGVCIIAHIVRLLCLKESYRTFSIRSYFSTFVIPASAITLIGLFIYKYIHEENTHDVIKLLMEIIILPIILIVLTYMVGLNKMEKKTFNKYTRKFITRKCKIQQ